MMHAIVRQQSDTLKSSKDDSTANWLHHWLVCLGW
jgi:hypothetical protein